MHLRSSALVLTLALVTQACSSSPSSETGSAESALAVDHVALPTAHTTLTAGDPYSPVIDERPLAIVGAAPCLDGPVVVATPGATEVEASIVTSRADLMNRLDLGVAGVPINVRQLTGATGTARLALDTKLSEGTLTLMFQVKGTFDTQLTALAAPAPSFDPLRVDTCGWGYVKKAHHRLSAVVMMTIEASDGTSRVRLGCGADDESCTPSGIGAGPVQATVALESMLRQGSYNISFHAVTDAIPDLPPTPFGDMLMLSSTPDTAPLVLDKLKSALGWLSGTQATIAARIQAVASDPSLGRAPTTTVEFAYYPGISSDLKSRLATSFDDLVALRNDYERTLDWQAGWDAFGAARDVGRGHLFNVPSTPAKTVDELSQRSFELFGDKGILTAHRRDLETRLTHCEDAARAHQATPTALVSLVETSCRPLSSPTWFPSYDTRYGIRRIAPISMKVKTYDEWRDLMCPPGQRIPTAAEAAILAPFSWVTSAQQGMGLWLQRESFLANPIWIKSGTIERAALFQAPQQVTLCFPAEDTLFD